MASPEDWSTVGLTGNPVGGDLDLLAQVLTELLEAREQASDVNTSLGPFLADFEGGFQGKTADALRTYIETEFQYYIGNVTDAFTSATDAIATYTFALSDAQDRAEAEANKVGSLQLTADDPETDAARRTIDSEVGTAGAAGKVLEAALKDATDILNRPVKRPKKTSFWKKLIDKIFKVLEYVGMALAVIGAIIGGQIALAAFVVGAVVFMKTVVDFAMGRTDVLGLALSALGVLFPSTKGLTSLRGLVNGIRGAVQAGAKGLLKAGGLLFDGFRALAPGRFGTTLGNLGRMLGNGLTRLSGAASRVPALVSSLVRGLPSLAKGLGERGWLALRTDFANITGRLGGDAVGRFATYTAVNLGRAFDLAVTAVVPLRYGEIRALGYTGAFRVGVLERGLGLGGRAARGGTTVGSLGRVGGLFDDSAKSLTEPGLTLRGSGLLTPDDLVEPLALPGAFRTATRGDSSLPRLSRFDTLDELGAPTTLDRFGGLDEFGTPTTTLNRFGGLDEFTTPGTLNRLGGTGEFGSLTTLDRFEGLDEFGAPLTRADRFGSPVPGPTAVQRLEELELSLGLQRTPSGLVRPADDLADLARFSIDGNFGGLKDRDLLSLANGEVDLAGVTPDGVTLRIGTTDTVDLKIGFTDRVTAEVVDTPTVATGPLTMPGVGTLRDVRMPAVNTRLDSIARKIGVDADDLNDAGDLLGLTPGRMELVGDTTGVTTRMPPLTLHEAITGGAVGKLATERLDGWARTQLARTRLDDLAGRLDKLGDVSGLEKAELQLDLSGAQVEFAQARADFRGLGMNPDLVRRDITVMTARLDTSAANLPTGELRLLDDLGQPTGQWITIEPGENLTWVLRADTGVVPDVKVAMTTDGFTLTSAEGLVTRIGPDGHPAPLTDLRTLTPVSDPHTLSPVTGPNRLGTDLRTLTPVTRPNRLGTIPEGTVTDIPLRGPGLDGLKLRISEAPAIDSLPATRDVELLDHAGLPATDRLVLEAGDTGENGGFTLTSPTDGTRWQLGTAGQLELRDVRLPGTDLSLRFDTVTAGPRLIGPDGLPAPLDRAVFEPVRDVSGNLTSLTVRAPGTEGALWRFDGAGRLTYQELPLNGGDLGGLGGLRVGTTLTRDAAGAPLARSLDLIGPSRLTGGFRLDPVEGTLAGRLPGGLTVTDTVTGGRFHFDAGGTLAFRDVPAADGGGLLRFPEGAPDAVPVRLDEPGSLTDLSPDGGGLEFDPETARAFDLTLDEASGFRIPAESPAVDLSGLQGALEFLEHGPDSGAFQALDLARVQQLADGGAGSLGRFGLGPDLLNGQLRQMTTQARMVLRQQATTALREYLDLPLPARLDDLRSVAEGGAGRTLGDFTVTPTPHGGPSGSRYVLTHTPSDTSLGFGANRELLHQELSLTGGPDTLAGLKLGIGGRTVDGTWTPESFAFTGPGAADAPFTVTHAAADLPTELRSGFTITATDAATSWHYGSQGVLGLHDVRLPGDRGVLRFDADAPGGLPHLLDSAERPLPGLRPELLDDGRIALLPTGNGAQPLERVVFDRAGTPLTETIAIRGRGGLPTGEYWQIDHVTGKAVRTDASGTALTGRFDTATVTGPGSGTFRLTGADPGKVTLFEREVLSDGTVLHTARDRFGRARWTEFDASGDTLRSGQRIGDADQRTFHDVPSATVRWTNQGADVRMYTKGIDGGLVRAEKATDGSWTWTRFDKGGAETLSGQRRWNFDRIGFEDTYADPATGAATVAQRRGSAWPFEGNHGSRMYQEYAVVPGDGVAGARVDPAAYTGVGPFGAQIESMEKLADGGSLRVARFADMRPPAFLWKGSAGRNPFDGFFRDLFAGDSLHRVSHWTETAADGTRVTGVRLNPTGANWTDIDQFGRVVRETRKLDNGHVVEVGRSLEDPAKWAPVPAYEPGAAYQLPWRDTKSGTTGTRFVGADRQWKDVFSEGGVDRIRLRGQGRDTREYLFDAPSAADLAAHADAGVWVDRNSLLHITGRRDLVGGQVVQSSGSPYRTSWTWRSFSPDDPATVVAEGVRRQNRGSFYSKTWDDSFVDLDRLGNPVRERTATDTGTSWIDAVRQPDGGWTWTKTAADGTVHSDGVRVYDSPSRWKDLVDGQTVRVRDGGRVREYDYQPLTPEPPAADAGQGTLRDLLARAARHFETPATVRVNPEVWKEFDVGKVFRERIAVDGTPGRFREIDHQWGQWREYQNGQLVAQRTFTGRVWVTDAFGRWSTSGPAVVPEFLAGALPRVRGEVGLAGDRGWRLAGREADFRGKDIEALGLLREVQDPWHGVLTGVRGGESAEMPVWLRETRAALTSFSTGFLTDFTASLVITAATNNGDLSPLDVYKALLTGTVGGTFSGGLNVVYNRTAAGYFKNSFGARDWGGHPKQSMATNTDDWATDWAAQEKPSRWRGATYANTVGLATGALSGFVSNAVNAAVFGVNGRKLEGTDALLAGAWGAAGSLFSGVTTGLARNAWHLTTGARVFHRGGLGDLGMTWAESALSRYITFEITKADTGKVLPSPSNAFPAATTTAPATPEPDATTEATQALELP